MFVVLVLDGDTSATRFVQEALGADEYCCTQARTATEADLVLDCMRADVVFVGDALQDGVGLEWLKARSADDPALARRTVVFSGVDLPSDDRVFVESCGATHLTKPAAAQQIRAVVQRIIAGR